MAAFAASSSAGAGATAAAGGSLFDSSVQIHAVGLKSLDDIQHAYNDAIEKHPFVHRGHYHTCIRNTNAHVRDSNGSTVCIVLRDALPRRATELASRVLSPAATRTTLRANIFGGESPLSGIAGYYDYFGSPITYKCRKTSFTCDVVDAWPDVFPMIEYATKLYEEVCPDAFTAQMAAVPAPVSIRRSPFSTLTINQRFRTAMHTDAGDFDDGFGLISCIDGEFAGCHLGFPKFGVCVQLNVGDIIFFETHHSHANTELEMLPNARGLLPWSRVTVVFYYRAVLGESTCVKEYNRRLTAAKEQQKKNKKENNNSAGDKKNMKINDDDDDDDDEDESSSSSEDDEKQTGGENPRVESRPAGTFDSILQQKTINPTKNGLNFNRPAHVFSKGIATPFSAVIQQLDMSSAPPTPAFTNAQQLLLRLQSHFNSNDSELLSQTNRFLVESGGYGNGNKSLKQQQDAAAAAQTRLSDDSPLAASLIRLFSLLFDEQLRRPVLFNEKTDPSSFRKQQDDGNKINHNNGCVHINMGIRPRAPAELHAVDVIRESAGHHKMQGPKLGGFSTTSNLRSLVEREDTQKIFTDQSLKESLSKELFGMWDKAKKKWLELVARDWKKSLERDKKKTTFSWTNTGDMNKAFFDLCDVAEGVMLGILNADTATGDEQNRFWAAFSFHLFQSCLDENKMPKTAMTMLKLNTKLKDHKFGGTRYFKDQSEEEKVRRLARKKAIASARKNSAKRKKGKKSSNKKKNRGGKKKSEKDAASAGANDDDDKTKKTTKTTSGSGSAAASSSKKKSAAAKRRYRGGSSDDDDDDDEEDESDSDSSSGSDGDSSSGSDDGAGGDENENWLDNDEFDYQTEDKEILYDAARGLPRPEDNAARFRFAHAKGVKIEKHSADEKLMMKAVKADYPSKQACGAAAHGSILDAVKAAADADDNAAGGVHKNGAATAAAASNNDNNNAVGGSLNVLLVVGNNDARFVAEIEAESLVALVAAVRDRFTAVLHDVDAAEKRDKKNMKKPAGKAAALPGAKKTAAAAAAAKKREGAEADGNQNANDAADDNDDDDNGDKKNSKEEPLISVLRRCILATKEMMRTLLSQSFCSKLGLFESAALFDDFVRRVLHDFIEDDLALYENSGVASQRVGSAADSNKKKRSVESATMMMMEDVFTDPLDVDEDDAPAGKQEKNKTASGKNSKKQAAAQEEEEESSSDDGHDHDDDDDESSSNDDGSESDESSDESDDDDKVVVVTKKKPAPKAKKAGGKGMGKNKKAAAAAASTADKRKPLTKKQIEAARLKQAAEHVKSLTARFGSMKQFMEQLFQKLGRATQQRTEAAMHIAKQQQQLAFASEQTVNFPDMSVVITIQPLEAALQSANSKNNNNTTSYDVIILDAALPTPPECVLPEKLRPAPAAAPATNINNRNRDDGESSSSSGEDADDDDDDDAAKVAKKKKAADAAKDKRKQISTALAAKAKEAAEMNAAREDFERKHAHNHYEQSIFAPLRRHTATGVFMVVTPLLTRDIFHFMLTEQVRACSQESGLPFLGGLLHDVLHPRHVPSRDVRASEIANLKKSSADAPDAAKNNKSNDENDNDDLDLLLNKPDGAPCSGSITFEAAKAANSFFEKVALSEFDISLSDCQRRVIML